MGFTHKHCKIGDGGFHVHNTNRLGSWVAATSKPYTLYMNPQWKHKMKWHRHHMKQNKTYFENPSSSETLRNSEGCQCWLISQIIGLALLPSNVAPGMQDIDANRYQCRMAAILDWVVVPAGQAGYGLVGLTCSALSTPFHPLVGHQFSLNTWPSTPETQGNYTFLQSNLAGKSPN